VNPPGEFANVTEWCKKEACWKRVCDSSMNLNDDMDAFLVDLDDAKEDARTAKGTQKMDSALALITHVVTKPAGYWRRASEWESGRHLLNITESGILSLIATKRNFVPSDKQAAVLVEVDKKLQEEGFH
jgi:hypothetical protein